MLKSWFSNCSRVWLTMRLTATMSMEGGVCFKTEDARMPPARQ
ncbi:MAG: hypothetical protein ACLTC4_04945 [Hungatella hathewayi]